MRNEKSINVNYEVHIYPNGMPFRQYLPTSMSELMRVSQYLTEIMSEIKNGIEIKYDNWEDEYITRIGAMLITPVIFLAEDDFVELYEYVYSGRVTQELCGKDQLYLKTFDVNVPVDTVVDIIDTVKHSRTPFKCTYDVMPYISNILEKGTMGSTMGDFRKLCNSGNSLIMSNTKNIYECIVVYATKMFGLSNGIMNDNAFLNNKNMGMVYLLNDSIIPSDIAGNNFYGRNTIERFMSVLNMNVLYYHQSTDRIINSTEYDNPINLDQHSRYTVFRKQFIDNHMSKISTMVYYNDRIYYIVEDECQIAQFKNTNTKDNIYILFDKKLEKKYKVSLLKSGAGGYDMIKSVHL